MYKADSGVSRPPDVRAARRVGIEFRKCYAQRLATGFIDRFLSGRDVLDIGFSGGDPEAVPITETAIGVNLDYPAYDGTHLPFEDNSQDSILASHVLEHIGNYREVLAEWYRVLKEGGFLVICVPHRYLYERRADLPSRWNGDHKRYYTPGSLLAEIEESLPVNGFRVRHLNDNDRRFRYEREPHVPAAGAYEIELVIEKIARPGYSDRLTYSPEAQQLIDALDHLIFRALAIGMTSDTPFPLGEYVAGLRYVTPWPRLCRHFVWEQAPEINAARVAPATLMSAVRSLLELVEVDESFYFQSYPELRLAAERGHLNAAEHWRTYGYFEGRIHCSWSV